MEKVVCVVMPTVEAVSSRIRTSLPLKVIRI